MPKFKPKNPFHMYVSGRKSKDSVLASSLIASQIEHGGIPIYVWKMTGFYEQRHDNGTISMALDESLGEIQDVVLMENRDRKYSKNCIHLWAAYRVSDVEMDFSRYGIMLMNDTAQIEIHTETMEQMLGRRMVPGDVVEVPHLRDVGNDGRPMNRYYEVKTLVRSSGGWDHAGANHLMNVTMKPMKDSQEFIDLMERVTENGKTLQENVSNRAAYEELTAKIQQVAQEQSHTTWWDISQIYIDPDTMTSHVWTDDGAPPNGILVPKASSFPSTPADGDWILRVDYAPARLYRFQAGRWLLREIDRKREWGTYNWSLKLSEFMTDRSEAMDARPWEYRSIHDVGTVREGRFDPSPKGFSYAPPPEVGSWQPLIPVYPLNPGSVQGDSSTSYQISLPGGITGGFIHPACEAPSGMYKDFYIQYTASRNTGQEVGEILINDDGSVASISQDWNTIGNVGITFSVGHSSGNRYLRYTSTSGQDIAFSFRVRNRNIIPSVGQTIPSIFELAVPIVGVPDGGETVIVYVSSHTVTLDPDRSYGRARVAATAPSTFVLRKNGSPIASFTFGAGQTSANVTITNTAIASGDTLTMHAPSVADLTLADIGLTVGGFR